MVLHAFVVGALAATAPLSRGPAQIEDRPTPPSTASADTSLAAAASAVTPPHAEEGTKPAARAGKAHRRRARKPAWSWRFVGAHYGTGVMASLLVLPGTYALASYVGHRGRGLAPVVGSMLIGALVPSPIIYTTQWGVARRLGPRRERFWPGLLVHQAGHLAVFAGSVLGGASYRDIRHAAPMVLADALAVTGLASLTAEATRRPRPLTAEMPELSWERHDRLWRPRGISIVVPIVKVRLP